MSFFLQLVVILGERCPSVGDQKYCIQSSIIRPNTSTVDKSDSVQIHQRTKSALGLSYPRAQAWKMLITMQMLFMTDQEM
jgi:hypothetical protein